MNIVKIEQFKKYFDRGKCKLTGSFGNYKVVFTFGKVKTGFGFRHFLICPSCGQYRVTLVFDGKAFVCVKCAGINPYRGIQTMTRGGYKFIGYKMARYAEKHGVEGFHFPFDYHDYERPKRRRREHWNKTMKVLQALESMRNQAIFFKKIWDAKTIQSVESGMNPYLELPILNLLLYMYPFDGKPINMSKFVEGAELFYDGQSLPPPDVKNDGFSDALVT